MSKPKSYIRGIGANIYPNIGGLSYEIKKSLDNLKDVTIKHVMYNMFLELVNFHLKIDAVPPGLQIDLKPLGFNNTENPLLWNEWSEELRNCSNSLMTILKYHYTNEITSLNWFKNSIKREVTNAIMIEKNCSREDAKSIVEDWIENSVKSGLSNMKDLFYDHNSKLNDEKLLSSQLFEKFLHNLTADDKISNVSVMLEMDLKTKPTRPKSSARIPLLEDGFLSFDNHDYIEDRNSKYGDKKYSAIKDDYNVFPQHHFLNKNENLSHSNIDPYYHIKNKYSEFSPKSQHSNLSGDKMIQNGSGSNKTYREYNTDPSFERQFVSLSNQIKPFETYQHQVNEENSLGHEFEKSKAIQNNKKQPNIVKLDDNIEDVSFKRKNTKQLPEETKVNKEVTKFHISHNSLKANAENKAVQKTKPSTDKNTVTDKFAQGCDHNQNKHIAPKKQRAYSHPNLDDAEKIRKSQVSFEGYPKNSSKDANKSSSFQPENVNQSQMDETLSQIQLENEKLRELLLLYLRVMKAIDQSVDDKTKASKMHDMQKIGRKPDYGLTPYNNKKRTCKPDTNTNIKKSPLGSSEQNEKSKKSKSTHAEPESEKTSTKISEVNSVCPNDHLKHKLEKEKQTKTNKKIADIASPDSNRDFSPPSSYLMDQNNYDVEQSSKTTTGTKSVISNDDPKLIMKNHQTAILTSKPQSVDKKSGSLNKENESTGTRRKESKSSKTNIDIKSLNSQFSSGYESEELSDIHYPSRRNLDIKSISSNNNFYKLPNSIENDGNIKPNQSRRTVEIKSVSSKKDLLHKDSEEQTPGDQNISRKTVNLKNVESSENLIRLLKKLENQKQSSVILPSKKVDDPSVQKNLSSNVKKKIQDFELLSDESLRTSSNGSIKELVKHEMQEPNQESFTSQVQSDRMTADIKPVSSKQNLHKRSILQQQTDKNYSNEFQKPSDDFSFNDETLFYTNKTSNDNIKSQEKEIISSNSSSSTSSPLNTKTRDKFSGFPTTIDSKKTSYGIDMPSEIASINKSEKSDIKESSSVKSLNELLETAERNKNLNLKNGASTQPQEKSKVGYDHSNAANLDITKSRQSELHIAQPADVETIYENINSVRKQLALVIQSLYGIESLLSPYIKRDEAKKQSLDFKEKQQPNDSSNNKNDEQNNPLSKQTMSNSSIADQKLNQLNNIKNAKDKESRNNDKKLTLNNHLLNTNVIEKQKSLLVPENNKDFDSSINQPVTSTTSDNSTLNQVTNDTLNSNTTLLETSVQESHISLNKSEKSLDREKSNKDSSYNSEDNELAKKTEILNSLNMQVLQKIASLTCLIQEIASKCISVSSNTLLKNKQMPNESIIKTVASNSSKKKNGISMKENLNNLANYDSNEEIIIEKSKLNIVQNENQTKNGPNNEQMIDEITVSDKESKNLEQKISEKNPIYMHKENGMAKKEIKTKDTPHKTEFHDVDKNQLAVNEAEKDSNIPKILDENPFTTSEPSIYKNVSNNLIKSPQLTSDKNTAEKILYETEKQSVLEKTIDKKGSNKEPFKESSDTKIFKPISNNKDQNHPLSTETVVSKDNSTDNSKNIFSNKNSKIITPSKPVSYLELDKNTIDEGANPFPMKKLIEKNLDQMPRLFEEKVSDSAIVIPLGKEITNKSVKLALLNEEIAKKSLHLYILNKEIEKKIEILNFTNISANVLPFGKEIQQENLSLIPSTQQNQTLSDVMTDLHDTNQSQPINQVQNNESHPKADKKIFNNSLLKTPRISSTGQNNYSESISSSSDTKTKTDVDILNETSESNSLSKSQTPTQKNNEKNYHKFLSHEDQDEVTSSMLRDANSISKNNKPNKKILTDILLKSETVASNSSTNNDIKKQSSTATINTDTDNESNDINTEARVKSSSDFKIPSEFISFDNLDLLQSERHSQDSQVIEEKNDQLSHDLLSQSIKRIGSFEQVEEESMDSNTQPAENESKTVSQYKIPTEASNKNGINIQNSSSSGSFTWSSENKIDPKLDEDENKTINTKVLKEKFSDEKQKSNLDFNTTPQTVSLEKLSLLNGEINSQQLDDRIRKKNEYTKVIENGNEKDLDLTNENQIEPSSNINIKVDQKIDPLNQDNRNKVQEAKSSSDTKFEHVLSVNGNENSKPSNSKSLEKVDKNVPTKLLSKISNQSQKSSNGLIQEAAMASKGKIDPEKSAGTFKVQAKDKSSESLLEELMESFTESILKLDQKIDSISQSKLI